jgi:cyclohexanone monooxygenase
MTSETKSSGARPAEVDTTFDAVVVGAGFAGMYMLHCLRKLGLSAPTSQARRLPMV